MIFKQGQILNFAYPNWLFQLGNLIHYHKFGYVHSAIVGYVDKKGVYLYEALDKGIVGSYYEKWWLDAQIEKKICAVGTPIYDVTGIESFCEKHIGDKYDYMNIIDIAIYWLTGKVNVRRADDNTWICSEFVAEMLRQANSKMDIVTELKLPSDDYISPMDLFNSSLLKWSNK